MSQSQNLQDRLTEARCSKGSLVFVLRSLAVLLESGVQIVPALDLLSEQTEDPQMNRVLREVATQVAAGHTLSVSFANYPLIFNPVFLATLRLAEQSGRLVASLKMMARWQEFDQNLGAKIRAALAYPLMVMVLAFVMTLALFTWVVPGFVDILEGMNVPLPWLTQLVLLMTDLVASPGSWLLVAGLSVDLYARYRRFMKDPESRAPLLRQLHKLPAIGSTLAYFWLARLCASLASLLKSGARLTDSLVLASEATGNPVIVDDMERAVKAMGEGSSLSGALAKRGSFYPSSLVQMVRTGEETGRLVVMLRHLQSIYTLEFEQRVEKMSQLVEPILLAGVGLLLGAIMVAILMPMYSALT